MATVNFSIPEEVKNQFNHLFAGQNKSAILTGLLIKAIEEKQQQIQRSQAIDAILELRKNAPNLSDAEFQHLRTEHQK